MELDSRKKRKLDRMIRSKSFETHDALAWDRQLCLGQWQWRGKVGGSRKMYSVARGLAELRKVASGSATQGLWLRNGKVRSQVSGVDRSRFPGRRTVWKIRRGGRRGRRASGRAKKRVYSF